MTIGQRIADCRKKLGLSQEALGERMGVSRQAISKWEADSALPEIDKLIALSKLFEVSVGWLLGVEELPQTQESLTEEQLKVMEQLVQRYAAPAQPKRRWLSWATATLAIAVLLGMGVTISNLKAEISGYSMWMNQVQTSLTTLQSRVEELRVQKPEPSADSPLHSYEFFFVPSELEAKATVRLSAVPRQRLAGEQVFFSVRLEGQEVGRVNADWDGSAYTAEQTLALENGYEYWLVLEKADGTQEQLPLEDEQARNLKNSFALGCDICGEDMVLRSNGNWLELSNIEIEIWRPVLLDTPYYWKYADIVLYEGGEEQNRYTFVEDYDVSRSSSITFGGSVHFENYVPTEGSGVEVWLELEISNGMKHQEMIGSWRYEDGEFVS